MVLLKTLLIIYPKNDKQNIVIKCAVVLQNRNSQKFRNNHKKTPVLESHF